MDTITLVRSAIRCLLRVADDELGAELRAVLRSGDDYASAAKPQIDWDDPDARDELIDSRACDAFACLAVLEGRELGPELTEASELLAKVVGLGGVRQRRRCIHLAPGSTSTDWSGGSTLETRLRHRPRVRRRVHSGARVGE